MAQPLPRLLGVLGAGQMGSGIAQVAAMAGIHVALCDTSPLVIQAAAENLEVSLSSLVSQDKTSPAVAEATARRIIRSTDIQALADADTVVEAIREDEAVKCTAFSLLDTVVKPEAILASNTSSISITKLAGQTRRPAQVVGMHHMYPVPLMPLVEIIRGTATSDAVFEATQTLSQHMGMQTILSEDRPGFVVNRMLLPLINEAFFLLMEGTGTAADIDLGMILSDNHPIGPLKRADLIGLDTCLAIMKVIFEGTGDSKYRPCPLLRQYVDAGRLGRKTRLGVFSYEDYDVQAQ
ncbi:hypothetical protein CVIRNUC_010671 [Coccomyxa viridis]|uniref:3-hydroxybutyryl-CoA dehydrogenase n=1 Tax=Coccomyxa viridis TaxID=1274662 RepID=A0AAV1IKU6_9CHLO|nr:hypothetical protein CVIRNUC_010671 [Coccomyxa viridis]